MPVRFLALGFFPFLFSFLVPFLPAQGAPSRPAHHLVRIFIGDARDLERALALDLDLVTERVVELPARALEVVADDADLARIRKAGFRFEIEIRNMEDFYASRLAVAAPMGPNPPFGKGSMGGYHTYAEVVKIMDDLHRSFPSIVSAKWSIGKSVQGRDLWVQKISDNVNVDENEPEVYFDALIHAREPMSMECTLALMFWLAENYRKDPLAGYLVNEREMFFLPVVNPDGYEYNRSIRPGGGGMWRKNRRRNANGTYGVDLNRNYPYKWGGPGSSSNPSSAIYRGPSPASEPEIKAILAFLAQRKFTVGFNSHTYSNLLLRPWGWTAGDPPNAARYDMISKLATKENHFPYGACGKILYVASGGAFDTFHQNYGMYGFSPEIGSRSDGFWPATRRILPLIEQNMWMFETMALVAGPAVSAEITAVKEVGGNQNGSFEPGETVGIEVTAANAGSRAGAVRVKATLASLKPGGSILNSSYDFGKLPAFTARSNRNGLLTFKIPAGARGVYTGFVNVTGVFSGGRIPFRIAVGTFRLLARDDAEKDLGWTMGAPGDTARTGRWNRMAPQRTTYGGKVFQPGSDTTPAPGVKCFVTDGRAGFSAGTYDVDGGFTTLLSPVMDLSHAAMLRFKYNRWVMDSASSDVFRVALSPNGGSSWYTLEEVKSWQSRWVPAEVDLPAGVNPGASMRLRFRAEDADPQSISEAAVDDLEIWGVVQGPSLVILGSGERGRSIRLCRAAKPGETGVLLASPGKGSLSLPGFQGTLGLDPARLCLVRSGTFGSPGYLSLDLPIPNDPSLSGAKVYFQDAVFSVSGGKISGAFSNLQKIVIK